VQHGEKVLGGVVGGVARGRMQNGGEHRGESGEHADVAEDISVEHVGEEALEEEAWNAADEWEKSGTRTAATPPPQPVVWQWVTLEPPAEADGAALSPPPPASAAQPTSPPAANATDAPSDERTRPNANASKRPRAGQPQKVATDETQKEKVAKAKEFGKRVEAQTAEAAKATVRAELQLDTAQLVTFMSKIVAARITDDGFLDAIKKARADLQLDTAQLVTFMSESEAARITDDGFLDAIK